MRKELQERITKILEASSRMLVLKVGILAERSKRKDAREEATRDVHLAIQRPIQTVGPIVQVQVGPRCRKGR